MLIKILVDAYDVFLTPIPVASGLTRCLQILCLPLQGKELLVPGTLALRARHHEVYNKHEIEEGPVKASGNCHMVPVSCNNLLEVAAVRSR